MTMTTRFRLRVQVTAIALFVGISIMAPAFARGQALGQGGTPPAQVHTLKITGLSTMLGGEMEHEGIGEWGFSALVEADGHRILVDTGLRPETVLQTAREMRIDLSDVQEVILTHNHGDHVGGLMTLRRELMKKNPAALSVAYVAKGIFYSRPSPEGEDNQMIAIRKEYEAT